MRELRCLGVLAFVFGCADLFANETCREYLITNLNVYPITAHKTITCTSADKTTTQRIVLEVAGPESPQRGDDQKKKVNYKVNDVQTALRQIDVNTEFVAEAIKFFKTQTEPKKENSPTEYELARRDVESNQFLMMIASWVAAFLLACTIWLLNKNRKQLDSANEHAEVAAQASREAATAAIKAQKAHIFPLLTARFGEEHFYGGIPLSQQVRKIKSKIIVEVRVCNLGKTPIRGGRVRSKKMSDPNSEVIRPFNALAAGQESAALREIEYSLSELIDSGRESSEIIMFSEFVDIDGIKHPVFAAWGDIQFTDSENRRITRQALVDLSKQDRLALIHNVEVAVRYVETLQKN